MLNLKKLKHLDNVDNEIYKVFRVLFTNVEEARNLLGFKPENRHDLPDIGEFFLFNEKEQSLLPTYLTEVETLTEIEKNVLKIIAKGLGMHFEMTAEERRAQLYWRFPHV